MANAMQTTEIMAGIVSVEFPAQKRAFIKVFPLDEGKAYEFAVSCLDHMQTCAGRVDCGSAVLPMHLVTWAQGGVWTR